MAALHREQLLRLCSNPETFDKAQSILRLANAKTRPGSGFAVKSPVAIPAVCAYMASQELNTGEVSLQSAMAAACVAPAEFNDILRKVRSALHADEGSTSMGVTYATLVDAYHVDPKDAVIACMEDTEAALPRVDMLKERYGANVLPCAIFYWVCQLLEESSVQARSLCQTYSIQPKAFKAILTTLDKQCDTIAEQIKSYLSGERIAAQGSASSKTASTSPQKPAIKSAVRSKPITRQASTPTVTPSRKRSVAFSRLSLDDDVANGDSTYPETPTKKRRVDRTPSPTKPSASSSPTRRSSTAAFHAAVKGSPAKLPSQERSSVAGLSTPHSRQARAAEVTVTLSQTDSHASPSRSRASASPAQPMVRRRFWPVFLEQQQWYARDSKVERMWAIAEKLRDEMVELHGHPFQRGGQHGREVLGAACA